MDLASYLTEKSALIDVYLRKVCASFPPMPSVLREAMEHTLFAPGKRIRPVLAVTVAEALGTRAETVLPFAAAIEMIHTYSLIHDDLPALDNDDLRRGRPTCHVVFGEAHAILAGDALLTEAFRIMTDPQYVTGVDPAIVQRLVFEISGAAGVGGMVGGQVLDILLENSDGTPEDLSYIHSHKTMALIRVSVRTGAIVAGASQDTLDHLTAYGEALGLCFQVVDDILDAVGDEEKVGKKLRKDADKQTYIKHYGIEHSRKTVEKLTATATESVACLEDRGTVLTEIARFLGGRIS